MIKDTGITQIKSILQHKAPQALLQDVAATDAAIDNWLARLILLGDVPFQNLIGDTRLLPQNSIRFFYVDPSWLYALVDGALSVGNNTRLEEQFTAVMAETIRDRTSVTANRMRTKLLGMHDTLSAANEPKQDNLVAGLLLRSDVVRAFPGLKIIPTYAPGLKIIPTPLRYETLNDDFIIVIFPSVPVSVKIQQPAQGLQFGLIKTNEGGYQARLRHVSGPKTGEQVTTAKGDAVLADIPADKLFRGGGKQVVDFENLSSIIQKSLESAAAYPTPVVPIISPQFAMQIINTPDEVEFNNVVKKQDTGYEQ
nr:hypothetical protein [uncultured Mucilaginibacter sp.]